MKEGWTTKKIGEIAKICLGLTHTPKYVENGVPFISVKDISSGRLSFKDTKYISREEFKEMPDGAKPQKGDLLFCRVGTIGKPQIIETDIEFGIFVSVGFLRIMDESLTKYTKYWMESPLFFRQVSDNVQGSTLKNLNTGWLKNFKINIPPRNEIDSITSRLDSAFAKIDAMKLNAEKALNEAKALFQASLKEMLEPKEGWEEKTLKEVSLIYGNYGLSVPSTEFNGVRYLRITDITEWGELNDEKVSAKIDDGKEQELLEEGDILFARTGATVGKTLMYKDEFGDCLFAGYLIRYRVKKDIVNPKFLFYITHSNVYYKWIADNQKAAAQPNISAKLYNDYIISYPPLSEQQSIVDTLDSLKSKVDRLQENCDKISQECDALKQAILRQVFE